MNGEIDDSELTEANFNAADEVLLRFPDRGEPDYYAGRRRIARAHSRLRESTFELMYGLRMPVNKREELTKAHFAGAISRKECGRQCRQFLVHFLDEQTLDLFYDEIHTEIADYGELISASIQLSGNRLSRDKVELIEREIGSLFNRLSRKSAFYMEELMFLSGYIAEARIANNLGNVQIGNFPAASYAALARLHIRTIVNSWHDRVRDTSRPRGISAAARFYHSNHAMCLRPIDISAMVEHEEALVKLYLRGNAVRTKADEHAISAPPPVVMQTEHVAVYTNSALHMSTEPNARETDAAVMSVQNWAELAIGIDEHRNFWALTPLPDFGSDFRISSALPLKFGGRRWPRLLEKLAESSDGCSAYSADVMAILGCVPSSSNVPHDRRVRRADSAGAVRYQLSNQKNAAHRTLIGGITDLNRKLRKQVGGPAGRNKSALFVDGDLVRSRFFVRALMKTDGHVYFGSKAL
jgi:hypothetical protein